MELMRAEISGLAGVAAWKIKCADGVRGSRNGVKGERGDVWCW